MAGALGFEPRLADSESAVLPLYDAPRYEKKIIYPKPPQCQTKRNFLLLTRCFAEELGR